MGHRSRLNLSDAEYAKLHGRIRKERGDASGYGCDKCVRNADEWSHIHGTDGSNISSHFRPLCRSCHRKYDANSERLSEVASEYWDDVRSGRKPMRQTPRQRTYCYVSEDDGETICGEPCKAQGMCSRHYQKFMKYGNPLESRPVGRPRKRNR